MDNKKKINPIIVLAILALFCAGLGFIFEKISDLPSSILLLPVLIIIWMVYMLSWRWAAIGSLIYVIFRIGFGIIISLSVSSMIMIGLSGIILLLLVFWLGLLLERHRQSDRDLLLANQRLKIVMESLNEGLFDWDLQNAQIYFSSQVGKVLGQEKAEITLAEGAFEKIDNLKLIFPLILEEDLENLRGAVSGLLSGESHVAETEFRIRRSSGKIYWILCRIYGVHLEDEKKPIRIVGSLMDITSRKQAEENLQKSEKRYRDLIEQQGEGVAIVNPNDDIIYSNPATDAIFQAKPGTLLGRNIKEFLSPEQVKVLLNVEKSRINCETITYELEITTDKNEARNLLVTTTPRKTSGGDLFEVIGVLRDITQRKEAEKHLRYMGTHDGLTGVYNRMFYDESVDRLERSDQFPISVLMIDLDGLKAVNDEFGHHQGDEVLKTVAHIIKQCVRENDIIARVGGDEFAVLLPGVRVNGLARIMHRIQQKTTEENGSNDNSYSIQFSIGGATSQTPDQFRPCLRLADERMYRNKRARRKNREK
jgi:diguanylate cyclase (GGDEF)-like protein/PAS domain S-box-containing protein